MFYKADFVRGGKRPLLIPKEESAQGYGNTFSKNFLVAEFGLEPKAIGNEPIMLPLHHPAI